MIAQCGNLFELKDLLVAHAIFKTKNNIKFNEDVSFHKEFTRKTKVIGVKVMPQQIKGKYCASYVMRLIYLTCSNRH